MEKFFKSLLLLSFIGSIAIPQVALSDVHSFDAIVEKGLNVLYTGQNCQEKEFCLNSDKTLKILKEQALQFKNQFDQAVNSSSEKVEVEWSNNPRELYRHPFKFKSLLTRESSHPSNVVHGILFNSRSQEDCHQKRPATLLIHKISDNIKMEELIARTISQQNRGSVMLIYLPEYGPRKSPSGSLITANKDSFRTNVLQALLDIHQAYRILSQREDVDQGNIGLAGFSLGGMITLISAGIDPVFSRYLTLVGGGDLANVMSYKYRHPEDQSSETARALKDVTWSTDQARFFLSQFDPITWAENIKNKKITMLNAEDDELLDKEKSIEKLMNVYKKNNPSSQLIKYRGGGHVVDFFKIGFAKSFKVIVFPFFDFINGGAEPARECQSLN